MGAGVWIIIIILGFGFWYISSHPEIIALSTVKNPLIDIKPSYNNTPSSTITQTPTRTYFGQPFAYYNCAQSGGDNSCRKSFLGTICETNLSSIYYGQCYANK